MKCRICNNTNLTLFLDLGHQPPSDAFLTEQQLKEPETYYPLEVYYCNECGLVQLGYTVPKEILFGDDYPYTTGTNTAGVEHFRQFAKDVTERFGLKKDDLVVDIGSNDGTLLQGFKDLGFDVYGIEPVQKAGEIARQNGINTAITWWNVKIAQIIGRKAKVITATNVFAHVDDLHDFMKGIDILLADDGVFVIEAPYLGNLLDNFEYDTMYHEHLSYLTEYPVEVLCNQYGMTVIQSKHQAIHGGSCRYFIKRAKPELKYFFNYKYFLEEFSQKVQQHREKLKWMLTCIKRAKKRIVGVSAPAKGNTLLNYCKIGTETLDYLTEKSKFKIGKYSPGIHIPVVSDERLIKDQPEYAMVLAWNFKEPIMKNLRKMGYKGNFIIPIPEPVILTR